MIYKTNKTGLERLISRSGRPTISRECLEIKKHEPSTDTKIRWDINNTIVKMIKEGKNDVMIEIHLTKLYPEYSGYILKMIAHHISKRKMEKTKNDGKERNE